ncbi:MAG: phosphate ABC transporter permease subunit PstC [Micrococcales bacterium]|nr:phosphate ABC transporter permease subunit PstC [Micrococcales bacterium]
MAPAGRRWVDPVFRTVAYAAAAMIVLILGGVGVFLLVRGAPAFAAGEGDLPAHATSFWQLAGPLAFGSAWAALIALALAAPVAVAVALFITMYAPRRLAGTLGSMMDLLAAIPSVVYGLWGLMVLAPLLAKFYGWLGAHASWVPLFGGTPSATGRTILTAGVVLAVMILPITASISREVFKQTSPLEMEASLALGATRWEMIRMSVLPPARSGIVSGAMLGLGRALGETMAVAMVLSPTPFLVTFHLINPENPGTVAGFIASNFPEAHGMQVRALIALGLVLFALTFGVNYAARAIVSSSGPSSDKPRRLGRRGTNNDTATRRGRLALPFGFGGRETTTETHRTEASQ